MLIKFPGKDGSSMDSTSRRLVKGTETVEQFDPRKGSLKYYHLSIIIILDVFEILRSV